MHLPVFSSPVHGLYNKKMQVHLNEKKKRDEKRRREKIGEKSLALSKSELVFKLFTDRKNINKNLLNVRTCFRIQLDHKTPQPEKGTQSHAKNNSLYSNRQHIRQKDTEWYNTQMLYQTPEIVVLTGYLHLIMLPQSTFLQTACAIHSWMYRLVNGRTYQITLPVGKHDVLKFPQPQPMLSTTTKSNNSKQFTYLLQCTENWVSCMESTKFNICYDSKCKYVILQCGSTIFSNKISEIFSCTVSCRQA